MDDRNKLFEQISDDYYVRLINWARKKTGNRADAEDLAQEVLVQVFHSVLKEQSIDKLDNFVWKIAHYVWCNHLRKSVTLRTCVSIEGFDPPSDEDFAENHAQAEEMRMRIKKMRLKISNLNFLQREIMIMHYIDGLSIKSISKKLNITEGNVKWHLHSTRKKLKKEIEKMENYVYRPGYLHMAVSGESGPNPDTEKINDSLIRQNICLVCYREAKTVDEIAEIMGIPKAYIEYELNWLESRQFIKNTNGKYITMFAITDPETWHKNFVLFIENKTIFSDVIINRFINEQDRIKAINFYGSNQPIEKLMWFLIYSFIGYALDKVVWDEKKYPQPERPIMPDGGRYFPLGFGRTGYEEASDMSNVINWNEKYLPIYHWSSNGEMTSYAENFSLHWYGLYNAGVHSIGGLFQNTGEDVNFLPKTMQEDFNIGILSDEEKEALSEMIEDRWVSKEGDKIIHNFSVFTKEQWYRVLKLFDEMYNDLKDVIYDIFEKIEKLCRADLPKHLNFYLNYHIYMAFHSALMITTGFAFYDGKLYDPKDDIECGMLTFYMIQRD